MTTVTLDKAEKDLAELIKRARNGEDIVISDGTGSGVRLAPLPPSPAADCGRGILEGQIEVSDDDLFGPLPEDELKRWWGDDE